jgi:hypothetical protein
MGGELSEISIFAASFHKSCLLLILLQTFISLVIKEKMVLNSFYPFTAKIIL